MKEDRKTEITGLIEAYLRDTGVSAATLAKTIGGLSSATVSQMRNGNWGSISDAMWNKVAAFLGLDDWTVVSTYNLNLILALCMDAQSNHRMMATAGKTGLGKTTALEVYQKKNANVYYVLCDIAMGKTDFIMAIARSMAVDVHGSNHQRIMQICEKLSRMSSPLLILDDAGKLNDRLMRIIQIIRDRTERSAGIVLAGTEYLKEYIDRNASRNKCGFAELKRRIGYWLPLTVPDQDVIRAICEQHGIKSAAAVKYVARTCRDFGTLRELITNAKRVRDERGIDINDYHQLAGLTCGDFQF